MDAPSVEFDQVSQLCGFFQNVDVRSGYEGERRVGFEGAGDQGEVVRLSGRPFLGVAAVFVDVYRECDTPAGAVVPPPLKVVDDAGAEFRNGLLGAHDIVGGESAVAVQGGAVAVFEVARKAVACGGRMPLFEWLFPVDLEQTAFDVGPAVLFDPAVGFLLDVKEVKQQFDVAELAEHFEVGQQVALEVPQAVVGRDAVGDERPLVIFGDAKALHGAFNKPRALALGTERKVGAKQLGAIAFGSGSVGVTGGVVVTPTESVVGVGE